MIVTYTYDKQYIFWNFFAVRHCQRIHYRRHEIKIGPWKIDFPKAKRRRGGYSQTRNQHKKKETDSKMRKREGERQREKERE